MRDLLDAAWGDFPTDDVGYDWARYTGAARPAPGWVDAVTRHSRLTFIQESYSTRSSEGYDVGVADCRYAESRAREVYPGYAGSIIVAVSDGNSADRWDASEYGRGWSAAATLGFLPYGTPAICASFCSGAGQNPLNLMGDMVPETWGTTVPPMRRLITQTVGASPVPNTDLDIVHADYTSAAPAPAPEPPKELPSMFIGLVNRNDPNVKNACDAHLVDGGVVIRSYSGPYTPWGFVVTQQDAQDFATAANVHPITLTADEWSRIQTRTTATLGGVGGAGSGKYKGTVELTAA